MNLRHVILIGFLLPLVLIPAGLAAPQGDAWEPFEFLIGTWTGEGGGGPGEGTGGFSFQYELDGKVLVRKNRAEYPKTKDRPAASHEDLMIIYHESPGGPFRAEYFDTEGHVIHYAINFSKDHDRIEFLSDAGAPGPRYRLTNRRTGKDSISIKFEIAPPGKPDAFTTYIEAKARKATPQ